MRRRCEQSGMSLMEVLVSLAIILILISTLVGVGSFVKTRANLDLTKGMIETLCTALEQYYDDFGDFPFETPDKAPTLNGFIGDDYVATDIPLDIDPVNGGSVSSGLLPVHTGREPLDPTPISSASSAALFYFLGENPSSRAIVENIADALVTNKDNSGAPIQVTLNTTPSTIIDLPRYIDPWGVSIRYEYLTGMAFPILRSAGPDKVFDTPDDMTSK